MAERNNHEDEIPECADGPTTVVSFFAREMEDIQYLGTINTGPDDPFLRPRSPEPSEEQKQKQGFGWHGRTLEDGVYEVDDDEDLNMGPQAEAAEGEPMPLVRAEEPVEEDFTEIEVDGEKFTENSSLRKLREALKICGLPKGKSKADAWERLKTYHKNFTESVAVELARREFETKRQMEGGDGVRGQAIPRCLRRWKGKSMS